MEKADETVDAVVEDLQSLDVHDNGKYDEEEDVEIEKSLEQALAAKEEGNRLFRDKEHASAALAYTRAIDLCPTGDESADHMATFFGNRAACHQAMGETALVVEDCTDSLECKPGYVKVLNRRCQAYETLKQYDEAVEDAKKIVELDPSFPNGQSNITRLTRLAEKRNEEMKDEALGKLKELGNSILGNFGMSLDNFKMTQDPGTGSWNVSSIVFTGISMQYESWREIIAVSKLDSLGLPYFSEMPALVVRTV